MKAFRDGLTGWATLDGNRSPQLRLVDAGITVTGTLLLAVTWMLLHQ